ncbi:MAG: N-acetylglutaminylglutamine amidotransferase [Gammaproteobacteria bacterium]|nr:N-acetylglutaminylglutamine amidotransferase [Gammaproteobacteria bacterium]
MCGIAGERHFRGPADPARITRMLLPLARRGPDHEGQWHQGPVALGHRRLSVIDLNPRAHQPLLDPDSGQVLVFNGCIYNYPQLRTQLKEHGHRFRTTGDSEVILKAYAEWSETCVERLHGMFAFALWDPRAERLFLARDRLGIKPLYYHQAPDAFRFASNVQSLLATKDVDLTLDEVALHHHLSLHAVVPAPRTLLRSIRKLAPGHHLTVDADGTVKEESYWQLDARNPDPARNTEEWVEQVHIELREAVRKRTEVSDIPVGVLLSGGLDSSLLVALLAEHGSSPIRTYSIGFEDVGGEAGHEFEYSDAVARHYDTEHHRYFIRNDQLLDRLDEAIGCMSEPMVAQDAAAFFLLAEQVKPDISVVQSGQGADEVFAGYSWYPKMQEEQADGLDTFCRHYLDRSHDEFDEALAPEWIGEDHTRTLLAERLECGEDIEFLNAVLRMDATMLITDDPVKRVDNMTMAWGLEARVPYLDHQLVECVAGMPAELKLRDGGKYPLRALARARLPAEVIDRPKGYFPVPALKYVQGPFLDWAREVLSQPECLNRGLFRREYLDRLLQNPLRYRTALDGSLLWHAAALECWLQQHVDGINP